MVEFFKKCDETGRGMVRDYFHIIIIQSTMDYVVVNMQDSESAETRTS